MLNLKQIQKMDSILKMVGSTDLYDALYLFVIPPLGILALAGNLVSYRILTARYFQKKPLYTYLRACCINSSVINFIFAITFICDSRRYLDIANSQLATYFRCFVKIPILSTCYFFGSILDILVGVDRLVEFTRFKKKLRGLNSHLVCLFFLIFSFCLSAPYILVFEPKQQILVLNDHNHGNIDRMSGAHNMTKMFYYFGESKLATSFEGQVIKYVQITLREIIPLLLMIAINVAILILFKKNSSFGHERKIERAKFLDINQRTTKAGISKNETICAELRRSSCEIIQQSLMSCRNLHKNVRQMNIMFAKMVFIICFFSTLEHVFLVISQVLIKGYFKKINLDTIFVGNFFLLINHSINPFVYFYFNDFFRIRFKSYLLKN